MADDDGTDRTEMDSARTAVGTVLEGLPDGCPASLRAVPQSGAVVDTFDTLRPHPHPSIEAPVLLLTQSTDLLK
ncbi:hypothetical protein LRD69_16050 [Streptomyces sp. JH14]|uniref:hypothetical protein n=1 Tax=Streptomyces sp. JH14 TaxID=2793630 RepID=UPI0023F939AE|nr:hypothetical protein [Streptomyces sp. JH14]MDF6043615.1 hypothetical protein [Streptomyces sp. JH14]